MKRNLQIKQIGRFRSVLYFFSKIKTSKAMMILASIKIISHPGGSHPGGSHPGGSHSRGEDG